MGLDPRNILSGSGLFCLIIALCLYEATAKVVLLELQSNKAPATLSVSLLGYPGYPNAKLPVTSQHGDIIVPALPNDLASETARDIAIKEVPQHL